MNTQQERPPPPAYTQHDPDSLQLPSVPTHSLLPVDGSERHLPGIRSLDLPDAGPTRTHISQHPPIDLSPKNVVEPPQWASLPPLSSATFPRVPERLPRTSADMDVGSPMDTASVVSAGDDYGRRREPSVLSVDDPDVRLAAEALSGLGNLDFARSPTARSRTLPRDSATAEPEPLLSLITSNHPWLGGTINGSISAYNATKGYSPRLVRYGAELIERNIGSPVVNTVSSVGRRTGVEKNLRRYLGEVHRRPSDLEQGDADAAHKRRRVMSPSDGMDAMAIEDSFSSPRTRGDSHSSYAESLPAYDEHRSPKYEESLSSNGVVVIDPATGKETESQHRPQSSQDRRVNWSTQLIMTTSGLGVALSDASLRSLKICLGLLRQATKHIDAVMHALKLVLEEYENALRNRSGEEAGATDSSSMHLSTSTSTMNMSPEKEDRVRAIASRMKSLSSDIWTTLQNVVQSVSRYTGGALPQNASQVVRTQLLSVPQRWQLATRTTAGEGEGEVRGAQRMLAFAKEGLDMMGQITTVVDGTVQSAEGWLGRMGRGGRVEGGGSGYGGEEKGEWRGEGMDLGKQ
ncbi:clock-controlled protein-like protein 8 [Clohesyomyces aquaticus]|uniref:Clock-controlled protein-like protein 8 n=1 Tax=Clohesyomyces aquaticus TaxID=1231657 RepID=A0A1Y1YG37_9PLEO|nr:clock-controlled protein-like protein 8 [Clohesyomyces aquaticus]